MRAHMYIMTWVLQHKHGLHLSKVRGRVSVRGERTHTIKNHGESPER